MRIRARPRPRPRPTPTPKPETQCQKMKSHEKRLRRRRWVIKRACILPLCRAPASPVSFALTLAKNNHPTWSSQIYTHPYIQCPHSHRLAHVQSFYIRHLLSPADTFVSLCAKQVPDSARLDWSRLESTLEAEAEAEAEN